MIVAGISFFQSYGFGVFVGAPFVMGFVVAVIMEQPGPRRFQDVIFATTAALVTVGIILLAFAFEGVFCLLMALPIALPLALIGGYAGHVCSRIRSDGPLLRRALHWCPL